MADILSRGRFDDEEVGMDFFEAAYVTTRKGSTPALNKFDKSKYDGKCFQIGEFLKTMTPDAAWTKEETNRIRKKAYRFFLRDRYIWKHPKKRNNIPLRVVAKKEEHEELLAAYPSTVHFKWMVDLVMMSMGVGQMRYLVMAREDLMNQVEGRAL